MMTDYCKAFAFDVERRQALLDLLKLGEADHDTARILHEHILEPGAEEIIDKFYAYLLQFPEFNRIITKDDIPALKSTQADYLRSFGVAFDTAAYFNHRLLVGEAHKRVGLSLGLYQCAYRELQQLMLDAIPDGIEAEGISGRRLCAFVHKTVALDMTLAIETYHAAHMHELEESLDELRSEGHNLRQKVITDNLTGVASREHAMSVLQQHLDHLSGTQDICVIMADLDFFKKINDTYGHLAGDEVLRQISRCLESVVREFDTVSRYGGEEFMIVLSQASPEIAMRVAERIQARVKAARIEYGGNIISTTISQGIAMVEEGDTVNGLLERADAALYLAKMQGRDRIVMGEKISNVVGG
jgi:diguanylate cyclase (GGDEF)-like protein